MQATDVQQKIWNFDQPISHYQVLLAFPLEGEWYTRAQVAANLRRAKSPTLILKLTDLAYHRFLHIEDRPTSNGVSCFYYALTSRGMDAILHGGFPPESL